MKRTLYESSFLLLVSGLLALAIAFFHPKAPALYLENEPLNVGEIHLSTAKEWESAGGVVWVDARPAPLFEKGHHPGALRLGPDNLETGMVDHFETLTESGRPIVIYCGSNACATSRQVQNYLEENLPGLEVHVLRGGWRILQP